jgi:hypothetical protein
LGLDWHYPEWAGLRLALSKINPILKPFASQCAKLNLKIFLINEILTEAVRKFGYVAGTWNEERPTQPMKEKAWLPSLSIFASLDATGGQDMQMWDKTYMCGTRYANVGQDMQMWDKICKCGTRYANVGQDMQMWDKIWQCGTRYANVEQDMQMWDKICKCGTRYANVGQDMQMWDKICKCRRFYFEVLLFFDNFCTLNLFFSDQ